MGLSVEKTGKTIQEAVDLALEELNAVQEMVDVEVLDEGSKGIFGLIGSKQARVRVTLIESNIDKGIKFLTDIFEKLNVEAHLDVFEDDASLLFKIKGDDIGIIIGRRGETLDALQYLVSLVVNKGEGSYKRVVLDMENYRQKREETLEKLANRLADKVIKYRKEITLESMNPYERRIIHSTLQNNNRIKTYSIGEEPNRKVVISLNIK